jgi:hypothetical protein
MKKQKPLSKSALNVLKIAYQRIPPYLLPLPHGIQGIAATRLIQMLMTRGYVDPSEAPKLTALGAKLVANEKFGKFVEKKT